MADRRGAVFRPAIQATATVVRDRPLAVMVWVAIASLPAGAASGVFPENTSASGRIAFGMTGVVAGTVLVLTAILAWAFLTARPRRLESQLDELRIQVEELAGLVKPDPAALRTMFRLLRDETQDNGRLMRHALQQNRYWKLTETAPQTKQWKRHQNLLAQERAYELLYEKGRTAAQEVDRVLQARSIRTFLRRDPRVKDEDRLAEVVGLLEEFERELTAATEDLKG